MPEQLSGILIHAPGTPPWLHRAVKVSISSELYLDYFWLRNFLDCSGIQFFDSPPLCQHSQLVYLCLPTPNCAALVWLTGHPCHASGHQVLIIQPLLREAEDFPRGGKHFTHVLLLTYLIYFSPKRVYMVDSIYMPNPLHGRLIILSKVLNQPFKSPISWKSLASTIRPWSLVT